ncbi:hypothetical protein COCON_G00235460, partial [Conger conger]
MAASITTISEGIYTNLDSPDHHVYNEMNQITPKKTGQSSPLCRQAAVALGLLCVILLTATITLCVLYMRSLDELKGHNGMCCYERNQLQKKDYNSLSTDKERLQKDYDNLMRQCRPTPPSSSCPESWKSFSCKCYLFVQTKRNWDDCRTHCQEQGADLVIINNEAEQEFISQNAGNIEEYWTGLYDPDPNQSFFRWVDGTRPQT